MGLKPGDYGFYDRSAEIAWVSGDNRGARGMSIISTDLSFYKGDLISDEQKGMVYNIT